MLLSLRCERLRAVFGPEPAQPSGMEVSEDGGCLLRGSRRSFIQLANSPHLLPTSAPPPFCDGNMSDASSVVRSRRRQSALIKQACDACKLRKVKCIYDDSAEPSELGHRPCQRCSRLTIGCTFALPQKCRGPRRHRRDARCVIRRACYKREAMTDTFGVAAMISNLRPQDQCQRHMIPRLARSLGLDLVMQQHSLQYRL
jgi:hypothetical protein